MPESHIRPALLADEAVLTRLDVETWSTLHAVTPRRLPPYDPFFDSNHRPQDYLVAQEVAETGLSHDDPGGPDLGEDADVPPEAGGAGGAVIGYIRVAPPTSLACNQHVRQIQGLAVFPHARGRGVARALLRAACREARRQGALRITLRVLGHNDPARSLYASEGFVVEGVLPGEFFIDGRYVDDVMMGRELR
ncbi:GNAT family N-acetyltransferase [Streptomyces albipurpureus]|uniref:GNAT family N-acetyltransferase n=1 Tax=Streptomyces albipurpureus TaxID=2897419 RepID=A0ABT0URA7_9ACTN|nr:GNAT family N-acetyltransferase [Streptomyces sp. CWNU-1]MCM2391083.1 GNAT family N-acetyltransferase [Streptomyces sp. CWNU-1]